MFFTDKKLESRTAELSGYRYRDVTEFGQLPVREDKAGKVNPEPPDDFTGWETLERGDVWKGRDRYLWLHLDVNIPAEWKGKRAVGVFDFGRTGAGNNSGFEAMLYLNGKPYQGVDSNHKEVFFKEELYGTTVSLTFRLWSGLEGGGKPLDQVHELKTAQIGWLDEATDDLYYLSDVILGTIAQLGENDPVRHELLANLDRAMHCIDWSAPGSEEFYFTVAQAAGLLNEKISAMDRHSRVQVYAVGHTHIDTAWLWRLKHTREKCSRSFSTVMRLMELFPEYIFLQTQPQLYAYIKEDFPELYESIRARVAEGRWEADGAMWVEADCNLTSGESLTRQILIGSRFIEEEFGKDVHYLWLPDVFGYSWALPQILKKSGIDMFMTTKISWNQYNRMPHDTFYWKGIDGSSVLTHFITTPTPDAEPGSWFYTYNGELLPKTVKGVWDAYSEKNMNRDLLIAYGFGDGGGGVNRDNLERRRRIDRMPGMPHIQLVIVASALIALGITSSRKLRAAGAMGPMPDDLIGVGGMPEEEPEAVITEEDYYRDINNIYTLLNVEPVEMEFGYSLIPLVDESSGGKLINRIVIFRRQFAQEMGFVIPSVRLRDSSALNTNQYVIKIKGEEVAKGEILTDYYLALEPPNPMGEVDGIETIEPAYGIPSKWITPDQKEIAEIYGYTVIDPLSVIVTHLSETIRRHVSELLNRAEVTQLVENLKKQTPELVEETFPAIITFGGFQKVLSSLLREGVPIKDLGTILESIIDSSSTTRDLDTITENVRVALKRTITRRFCTDGQMRVITLDAEVEKLIASSLSKNENGLYLALNPEAMQKIITQMSEIVKKFAELGQPPIILTSHVIRLYFYRLIEQFYPDIYVLSFNEIANNIQIQAIGNITL